MVEMTRKAFLHLGAAAAMAGQAPAFAPSTAGDGAPVEPLLAEFGYGDVVLGGRARQQFEANHAFFMALNEDSMLKPYRFRTGLPAPGADLGGWYSDSPDYDPHGSSNGFVPGHALGQYISGLARAYAINRSPVAHAKVERLVRGLAPALSEKFYRGHHNPCYVFDKVEIGLIDAYRYAGVHEALPLLDKAVDAIVPFLPERAMSRAELYLRPHANEADCWDESYTLPENLFLSYKLTGKTRYRDLAVRFLHDASYFNPLAAGNNVLPGLHAYSHVNALSSAMQAYLTLGSRKHLRAAANGFDFVQAQSYVTGGWGPVEEFRAVGSAQIGMSLFTSHDSFETCCGSYAHFKICRYLMRATGDSRYGDSMERIFYNAILGAMPLSPDGRGFYYSDYNSYRGFKTYRQNRWHCCTGSFSQLTADYAISAYFRGKDGAYVNLYIPSKLSFRVGAANATLTQTTDYPYTSNVAISVGCDRPQVFTVALRIPAWAGAATTVAINGKTADAEPVPGTFLHLRREWSDGDRIELTIDRPLRLEAIDLEHPEIVAPAQGPLALFALENLPAGQAPQKDKPIAGVPAKLPKGELFRIRQSGDGAREWRLPAASADIRFKAFCDIGEEHYRLYHRTDI